MGDNDATKKRKGTANDALRPFNPAPPPKPTAELCSSFTHGNSSATNAGKHKLMQLAIGTSGSTKTGTD